MIPQRLRRLFAPRPQQRGAAAAGESLPLYPRSFFRFLVAAFSLVVVPPLVCLVSFAIEANTLADRSEQSVRRVAWITQDVLSLQHTVRQMERLLRQSIVLAEPPSRDAYDALHDQAMQAAAGLAKANLPPAVADDVHTLLRDEALLAKRLAAAPVLGELPTELSAMSHATDRLASAGPAAGEREIDAARRSFFAAQQRTFYALAVIVPLALAMAAIFTALLAEPVRAIDSAIERLGAGELDAQMSIDGPQDIRLLGQRLDWLRRRLKGLEADRELLSQSISHDLKTPLTSISEGIQLLQHGMHGSLGPQQEEIVDIMRSSVAAMSARIESLMVIRSGALRDAPLALRPLDLRELLDAVVRDQHLAARAKQLRIAIVGPPLRVTGDRGKLRIVFDNLLSNAVRFSPPHGRVRFSMETAKCKVRVSIDDEGPGIPVEYCSRVFETGFRSDGPGGQSVQGSGIGLSIAREFVLAHGGRIGVDPAGSSLRQDGARLVVELPGS